MYVYDLIVDLAQVLRLSAFQVFSLSPCPNDRTTSAGLSKLAHAFNLNEQKLISQFLDFRKYAGVLNSKYDETDTGSMTTYHCWQSSIQAHLNGRQ